MATTALVLSLLALLGLVAAGIYVRYNFVLRDGVTKLITDAVKKALKEAKPGAHGFVNQAQLDSAVNKAVKGLVKRDWLQRYYTADVDLKETYAAKDDLTTLDERVENYNAGIEGKVDDEDVKRLIKEALTEDRKTLVRADQLPTKIKEVFEGDKPTPVRTAAKTFVREVVSAQLQARNEAPPPPLGQTVTSGFPSVPPTKVETPRGSNLGPDDFMGEIQKLSDELHDLQIPDLQERVRGLDSRTTRALGVARRVHRYATALHEACINPLRVPLDRELEELEKELEEGHLVLKEAVDTAEGEHVMLCAKDMKENPTDADLRMEAERHIGDLRRENVGRSLSYEQELELKRQYIAERPRHKLEYDEKLRRATAEVERSRKALEDFNASTDVKKKKLRVAQIKADLEAFAVLEQRIEEVYQELEPGFRSVAPPPPKPPMPKRSSRRELPSRSTAPRTPTLRPSAPPSDAPMDVEDNELEIEDDVPSLDVLTRSLREGNGDSDG